jgi:uncharacterized caspase-like protein
VFEQDEKAMRPGVSFLSLCLLLISAYPALIGSAAAQPSAAQEKRIALVVGNGAYAKAPLATSANDAGLIAQTLQAAGFDVIGARDLDGDSLRKSYRDFLQKAQASPADTVAFVYLAGYGVQLVGENYFIPVDSTINHDTDIPIEALRISDYTRQLAAVPLKASVIVLDAARQQPFIEGGNPIASGLALADPSPNMLIAFNAAPGTVAPSESGNYGVYAQSLAEMIRTGGLSLPDVFDRVRLRVSETSKGAQIPWDAQKIQAQFTFFDRSPDAPPVQGAADQVAAIRERPIRDLSVQDAYTAALARDTMQGYEDFLAAYPGDPLEPRVRAILAARREAITWRRTYLTDTPEAYWSYLRRYPRGPHAWDARRRLAILTAPLEPPPAFAVIDYDLPPPPPEEIFFVDRPVFYFGDPEFDFVPPPPPPIYYLPPPPPDFVILAPPIVPIVAVGLFILPQPVFVPIPVYCSPPAYVAVPPNNIIFNNIHNTTVINTVINNPAPAVALAPGALAQALGPRAGVAATVGPPLPPAVAQRANLIQQGKLPSPPSASINVRAKPGTPEAEPANLTPSPSVTPQGSTIPRQNAPPGTGGIPPPSTSKGAAPLVTAPRASAPNAKPAPTPSPSISTAPGHALPTPPPSLSKPPVVQTQRTSPSLASQSSAKPTRGSSKSMLPAPPPPSPHPAPMSTVTPKLEHAAPPRMAAPPPRMAAPPPPPRMAAPPPPQRMAAPPPPPRMAAPPPPRMAAPPPPRMAAPPPRVAAPPPPRMAAPPPPRMAAPPPPRMAAPPPPPRMVAPAPPPRSAGRQCPPNVAKCG